MKLLPRLATFAACALLGAATLTGCGLAPGSGSGAQASSSAIVIGSKNFTENELLAQMMADLLRKDTSLKVTTKLDMNGTSTVFQAIKAGQIDVYPAYTGTAYMDLLKKPKASTENAMLSYDQKQFKAKFRLEWLKPFGFNDTYAIAVTQAYAKSHHLTSITDLVPLAPTLLAGIDPECATREDCLLGLEKTYGIHFKSVDQMDHSLVEEAMANGKIQATDVYTTDGALLKYHLTVLQDNKHFFPAYLAAPVIRVDWAKAHPNAVKVLNRLAGKISNSQMEELDYEVDIQKGSIQSVAKKFLTTEGLL